MAQILLIDGDSEARDAVGTLLRSADFGVIAADSGQRGLCLLDRRPDLVLLEFSLPDISGIEVCRTIRGEPQTQSTPLVFLSQCSRDIDRVMGFEVGADDYIAKPFNARELVLRLRALLRRTGVIEAGQSPCVFGGLRIDRDAHRVWVDGERVQLTAIEFRLLLTLYEHRNRVQSREALLQQVWGATTRISVRTVDAHVKRLRERIRSARDYVETVRGVGYRFAETPIFDEPSVQATG
jgi:two-component system phosphate regulon response regulator PhoB